MKIPFDRQRLQQDPVETLSSAMRLHGCLSGDDVLHALESMTGCPLRANLRASIRRLTDPTINKRGRPALQAKERAEQDLMMEELDEQYLILLAKFENDKANADGQPPSERAYRTLAYDMREHFGSIDWRSLQNKHSAWRNGRLNMPVDKLDSEDFDAEIDRQFPRTQ